MSVRNTGFAFNSGRKHNFSTFYQTHYRQIKNTFQQCQLVTEDFIVHLGCCWARCSVTQTFDRVSGVCGNVKKVLRS